MDSTKSSVHRATEVVDVHPHCCWDGYVYLGFTYVGEDGEEHEGFERIPCRRCVEAE
jgi:hypothetical protein